MSVFAALRWLGHELIRPRGPVRHRFYRATRRSRAGVALLMAITAIMLLTILVTEIAHGAVVRAQLASQYRDDAKAEALAISGLQFYRMILMASAAIGSNPMVTQMSQMFGVNATELWQAIPFIDTRVMRMIIGTKGRLDEDDVSAAKAQGGLSDAQIEASREGSSLLNRPFLDFDGDFHASVKDEERRIYVGQFQAQTMGDLLMTPSAQMLMAMMSTEENQDYLYSNNIVREELIGNLADWTDADDTRIYQGGSEDALYQRLDPPYRSKNQAFDTRDEIRLVDGWHLDGVWQRIGQNLTIYGGGKVNINTASQEVLKGLLMTFAEGGAFNETAAEDAVKQYIALRGRPMAEGGLVIQGAQQFQQFFETMVSPPYPLRDDVQNAITTQSKVFRITSAGEVGTARVEVQAVIDFSNDAAGKIMFWRVR